MKTVPHTLRRFTQLNILSPQITGIYIREASSSVSPHKENKHDLHLSKKNKLRETEPQTRSARVFILMRILLNALVELISSTVDLEKDLFYLGSCHWSKGIQESPQIRLD